MSHSENVHSDAHRLPRSVRFTRWLWKNQIGWIIAATVVLVLTLLFRQNTGTPRAKAATPEPNAKQARAEMVNNGSKSAKALPHDVMALVNGSDISRQDLTDACVRRYGEKVLESLVNKRLILSHCEKRQIAVTNQDIEAEIDRMAKRFRISRDQWLEMLQKERGITAQEYARDIVWPTLALRKLAAEEIQPSAEEIAQAYDREFGETVSARMIAVSSKELAEDLRTRIEKDPKQFARLAIEHSVDVNSASVGGLIQPIRRHLGDITIEQAAFSLKEGETSAVLPVAGQFVLLQCIARNPAPTVDRAEVEAELREKIADEKLREASHDLFARLQASATMINVYNNPQLRQTMPGVVATVNGDRITLKELGDECLLRHGNEVLETEISHLLLEQAMKNANLTVSEADIAAEMRHAAELAGVVDEKGNAKLDEWIKMVTEEEGIDEKLYLRDAVWPSAALKKLTASMVEVTEEDLNKGFEANYGERVRCRAIVLPNMRRAQEVWDKARRNPSIEFFGDLAEQYSIEPTSRSLRGEVPPIQRFGGQPQLEQAAFQLKAGELSGIVQVLDKFVVLRCEGRTERMDIDLNGVRDILSRDIYEKKLRLAMSEKFNSIREQSRIDNYLAGTSQAPVERTASQDRTIQDPALRPTSGTR